MRFRYGDPRWVGDQEPGNGPRCVACGRPEAGPEGVCRACAATLAGGARDDEDGMDMTLTRGGGMRGGKSQPLRLVEDRPALRVVQGELDRHTYLTHQHRQVREAASRQVSLRPKLVGVRPSMRLYKVASGHRTPLAAAFQLIEDMAVQRDQEQDASKLPLHDTAILTLAWTLMDYAVDAIDASNQRRDAAKKGGAA